MFLKVKFSCDCGCVSEYDNETTAKKIYCPNCGNELCSDISEKLLLVLRTANEIPEDDLFPAKPRLEFVTSPWEAVRESQPDIVHSLNSL